MAHSVVHFGMQRDRLKQDPNRRQFCQLLGAVPVAAAVAFGLQETPSAAEGIQTPRGASGGGAGEFTVVKAAEFQAAESALGTTSGNKGLASPKNGSPFTVVVTSEEKKAAAEFEWHEARDHVFYILDGATSVELGGKPTGAHQPKAGEWLAPASEGAKAVMLQKGDMLAVARGTPHKRTTEGRVVFQLVSIELPLKS